MTLPPEDSIQRLRDAIDALAARDAEQLVAEARAEALATVRTTLSEAMAESLIAQVGRRLGGSAPEADVGQTGADVAGAAPKAAETETASDLAWYLYGVLGVDDAALPAGLVPVDPSHAVSTLAEGGLAAIVSQVSLSQFGEAELRDRLTDLEWVERTARAHEGVLDELSALTTVIPMRMCTVYRTEGGVREMLSREQRPLQEALHDLAGKLEWGVKVFSRPDLAHDDDRTTDAAPASGTAYMSRRREERDRLADRERLVAEAAGEIHERLRAVAGDSRLNAAGRSELDRRPGEMVLNGVYLVDDPAFDRFQREVLDLEESYGGLGLELVATGPWPPYHFLPDSIGTTW